MPSDSPGITCAKPLVASEGEHLVKVATESLLGHLADICDGAIIVDRQARVVWMNDRYPKRLGLADPALAIGQPVESIVPNSFCLLYTSPSPRDGLLSRMPSSA